MIKKIFLSFQKNLKNSNSEFSPLISRLLGLKVPKIAHRVVVYHRPVTLKRFWGSLEGCIWRGIVVHPKPPSSKLDEIWAFKNPMFYLGKVPRSLISFLIAQAMAQTSLSMIINSKLFGMKKSHATRNFENFEHALKQLTQPWGIG